MVSHYHYPLDRQVRAAESRSSTTRIIRNNSLNSSIKTRPQQEQSSCHNKNMDKGHDRSSDPTKQISLVQLPVCDSEVDESEERVECSTEKGEEISHAGHDFRENERDDPDSYHHRGPDTPSNHGVAVCVARPTHDAEVDELCANVGVNDANYESWDDDECEGSFLVRDDS